MKIKIGGSASSVKQLTDVNTALLADGKVLQYDGTTEKWIPKTISGASGGVDVLDDLSDVESSTVATNQILQYNGTNWIPIDADLSGGVSEELDIIGFTVNANNEITTGAKGFRKLPFDSTLEEVTIITDSSTNVLDISVDKTSDYINYTNVLTIGKINVLTSQDIISVEVLENEMLRFSITSINNIKNLYFFVKVRRNI